MGVATLAIAAICLVILVTGWRLRPPIETTAARSASGDRTSPPADVTSPEDEKAANAIVEQIEARQKELGRRREAIVKELNAGWPMEVAEGRAAMLLAGLDPDDVGAVTNFNYRHGAM